jgi:hypothetical protein
MQDLTDELPDPDESTSTMLLEDRRHRVPDIWEAVRTGLDGGVWTFPGSERMTPTQRGAPPS